MNENSNGHQRTDQPGSPRVEQLPAAETRRGSHTDEAPARILMYRQENQTPAACIDWCGIGWSMSGVKMKCETHLGSKSTLKRLNETLTRGSQALLPLRFLAGHFRSGSPNRIRGSQGSLKEFRDQS